MEQQDATRRMAFATTARGPRTRWRPTLVATGMLLCMVFVITAAQVKAAQPPSFLNSSHWAPTPTGARQLCATYSWACSVSSHASIVSTSDMAAIERLNRSINRSVRFVADQTQYGETERWTLPTSHGGDCEDLVLLKKRELIRRGFPAQALLIATALDRKRQGHAVLIVRTNAGDMVLDNLTDRVKRWSDTGYIFLRMQNPASPARWLNVALAS